jgi:hypothetical protein
MDNNKIFMDFVQQNPGYAIISKLIIDALVEHGEDEAYLKELSTNDCFTFTLAGVIDRLYEEEDKISEDEYKRLSALIKQLEEFNYFNYYNNKVKK